jgi:HlyD family secretion protein
VSDGTADGNLQLAIFSQRQSELSFKVENYRQKISSLDAAVKKAQGEITIYTERAGYAQALLKSREDLERQGVGSRLNTLQARDSNAEAMRALASAKAAAVGGQRDMEAMIAERDGFIQQFRADLSQQLTDEGRKLSDAREQLAKAQKHSDLVEMRAETDATVLGIASVSVGSVLNPGEPFLTLVPDDAVMEVDGAIAASEVGFIRVGDPVVIKFAAYPFNQHGYAEGTVLTLAPDAQDNPSAGQNSAFGQASSAYGAGTSGISKVPVDLGSAVYRVKISIDALKLTNVPADFRLKPGLGVEADIQDGKRTMLSYLLARFLPMLQEGMREP